MHVAFVTLALILSAAAAPRPVRFGRRQDFALKNGQDAIALNEKFKGLTEGSPCTAPEDACVGDGFAQCVNGKFVVQPCAGGTICAALPLVNSAGTSITCTTAADRDARIAATGATGGGGAAPPPPANGGGEQNGGNAGQNNAGNGGAAGQNNAGNNGAAAGGGDPQTSLTLDPDVIAKGFANNGADAPDAGAGVFPSITSTNNFINFCKNFLPNTPITDGKQIESGSCNPTPMGQIPAKANMPSSKFQFPVNFQKINVNEPFQIKMAIKNLETGFFTNAKANYYSGPQQLNDQGIIKGHSHVVIEKIDSFTATQPANPSFFEFFLGLNGKAQGDVLTADVTKGLTKVGFYKLSSINAAANHQPVLAPVAQHGSLDDAVYFEVVEAGANNGAAGGAAGGAAAPAPPANLQANTGSKKGSNKKAAKKN